MLLAVDLGNTHTTLGLWEGDRLQARHRLRSVPASFQALPDALAGVPIDGVAIASVVPSLTPLAEQLFAPFSPFIVGREVTGLIVEAEGAGADRIMNALAAQHLFGSPVLAIDLGTATTFELVQDGVFRGGAILPGWGLFAESLSRTAQLPPVEPSRPPSVVGTNTRDAIRSGLYWGYLELLDGLIKRFEEETGPLTVVATGGLGEWARPLSRIQAVEPDLTLLGLRLFWEGK